VGIPRERVLDSLGRLPPFSPVLNRLLATIAGDQASFGELAALVENDTVLAGYVLKIVNSPLYAFEGRVNSVRHAVAILGLARLRNVALSLSIARMWTHARTAAAWSGAKFNTHSVAVAILSDLMAQQCTAPYPEGAFVAGLLHDIGKLVLAISFPAEFMAVRALREETDRPEIDCEQEAVGVTHAEISGLVLESWKLPGPIERAVWHHHAPDEADGGKLHLSHVIRAADEVANELGHSTMAWRARPGAVEGALRTLRLEEKGPHMLAEFQVELEVQKAFF
jgi:HD-like signal output (HDOD) protein